MTVTSEMPGRTPSTTSSSSSASEEDSGEDEEKPEDAVRERTVDAGEASSAFRCSLSTLTVQEYGVSARFGARAPVEARVQGAG